MGLIMFKLSAVLKKYGWNYYSSYNQVEKLNELIDRGTPMVLLFEDKKYLVYIDEPVDWKRINFAHGNKDKSYFEGKMQMIVKEEVVL